MKPTTCNWCGEDYNDCNGCTRRGVYVEPEHLARLERRAKDWAKGQVDVDTIVHPGTEFCRSCDRGGTSERASVLHSADCDAAIILDLERESVG